MKLVNQSYKVLGYDGPVPEGFVITYIDGSGPYIRVQFNKATPIPESTMTEYEVLTHFMNQYGTVVLKRTEIYHSV